MKKFIVLSIVLLMLAGFAITSSAEDVTLWAGQNIDVGYLTVAVVGDYLEVTYEITEPGWELLETHLYVGKTDPKLLTSAPGQFPYSEPLDTPTSHTYTIPIADIDSYSLIKGKKWVAEESFNVVPGDKIYIAAHAEIGMVNDDGDPIFYPDTEDQIEETAWADGPQIRPEKNWAMYFEFVVPE